MEGLKRLVPFSDGEIGFLDGLRDRGLIEPSFLTGDPVLAGKILNNPPLQWRAHCRSWTRQG